MELVFFGKFELSNFFAIKTGVNYNYLGAKDMNQKQSIIALLFLFYFL